VRGAGVREANQPLRPVVEGGHGLQVARGGGRGAARGRVSTGCAAGDTQVLRRHGGRGRGRRVKRGGLGRGLAALSPGASQEGGLREIPVAAVEPNPRQPRIEFAEEALAALARSIREVGVLQPIVVRVRDGGYELVAGERRLRAARLAGLPTVPAIIRES